MKKGKKIGAIVLAIVMIAMVGLAYAVEDFSNGKAGEFSDYDSSNPDTTGDGSKAVKEKTINIKKQFISINASETTVNAPAFTYIYTVTPADAANLTVIDSPVKHASGTAVQVPVKAGNTERLVVTGTSDGAPGDATSATGSLVFTNTTILTSSADGTDTGVNTYDIKLNFTNVAFQQAGIYRYKITESLADSATYDGIAVKDGGSNIRYLDVYVDGAGQIYGYVCMSANSSVTPESTNKTNGFVEDTNHSGTNSGADYYYTYNLTLSKDVVNDNYGQNHAFPFTVFFKNPENYTTTFAITESAGSGSTGFTPALSAGVPTWNDVVFVKKGANIEYKGIPAGVDVDVYETNDMTGVTYSVSSVVNSGTPVTNANVSWGSVPSSAKEQTSAAAYESQKVSVDTAKTTTVDSIQTIAITNTLVVISPTGVVLRVAPYLLMLAAGIALLAIFLVKRRKHHEEE